MSVGRIIKTHDCIAEGTDYLASIEPRFAHALELTGPPPLRLRRDGFAALLDAIVSQQVSVASANAIWKRLEDANLTGPRKINAASDDDLRACGLSRQKMRYARELSQSGIKFNALRETLGARVFGQEAALDVMVRLMRRAKVALGDPRRPAGVALFLGPSGVGKTELAKCVAEELFGGADKLLRFDMSEFNQPHQVARLVGSPPGYVGHGEGGELTEAIRRKPNSVVLLDEIEKAHPDLFNILHFLKSSRL